MQHSESKLRNTFAPSEWTGAVGDLGTMLPLAFALVIFNGYSPHRLFFLWGLVYLATGWYYRVPVAVQPLKAMAVIAITAGYQVTQLATAALFFGVLMILLSATGVIRRLQRWFTPALVRGIQLGIGLILLHKAVTMTHGSGLYFGLESSNTWLNVLLTLLVVIVLGVLQFRQKIPVSLPLIVVSIGLSVLCGVQLSPSWSSGSIMQFQMPDPTFLGPALMYLMIPQLPLTLGNAVFAACDTCRTFWPERSDRVRPTRFGLSIGFSNTLIGLGGGFPICHGAGGIAAHARFGGRTGGTTILIGGVLTIFAIIKPLASLLFYIPIPVLGALLIFTSWMLIVLVKKLETTTEIIIAVIVGLISFITRNITIALITGILVEHGLTYARKRTVVARGENL